MSAWLEDDPELLRATQAFVDSWWDVDTDLSGPIGTALTATASPTKTSDSGSDSSQSPDDTRPTRSPVKAAKASTHRRRRDEMLALRDQIRTLEARIVQLRSPHESAPTRSAWSVPHLWRGIAQNQRSLRRQSELEQARLRNQIKVHMAIAQGMAKLMRRAQELQAEEAALSLQREMTAERLQLLPHTVDQFDRVNLMYENLETVFAHAKFHEGSTQFVDAEIFHGLEKEVVLEFRETWTVPFEPLAVLGALWTFTLKRYEQKWRLPGQQVLVNTDDAFVSRFVGRAKMHASLYAFAGQLVIRRFADPHSDHTPAIVTNLFSTPLSNDEEDVEQVCLQEHSCLRVLSLPSPDGSSPLTQIQCSYHTSVKFDYEDDRVGRRRAGVLADFVLGRLQSDVHVKRSTVEDSLLHSSLKC